MTVPACRPVRSWFGPLFALILVLATASMLGAQGLPAGAAASNGPAGVKWVGGNRESPLMNPGLACIDCHSRGEGPRFPVAGTVYSNFGEKDLDFGVEGAYVLITDSKGQVLKLPTNKAGNFFAARSAVLAFPITAKVSFNGKERAMYSPQATGDCNRCHGAKGVNGAPGRVAIP